MSKIVLYITVIVLTLIVVSSIISVIKSFINEKRISSFALSYNKKSDLSLASRLYLNFWRIVHYLSKYLGKSNTIKSLASNYQKYVTIDEEKLKSGEDYITIKIFSTIFAIIVTTVLIILDIIPNNLLILVIAIVIGYILPDAFFIISYSTKKQEIQNKIYESVIILENELKTNDLNIAINSVISKLSGSIKDEYLKLERDLSYGISLKDAYKRFYDRCKINELMIIYHILDVDSNNLCEDFKLIRQEFDYYNEKNINQSEVRSVLTIMSFVYLIFPLIIIIIILIVYPDYFRILKGSYIGGLIVVSLVVIYALLGATVKKAMEALK